MIQAVDVAGDEGQRSLLVLSDGADTSETPIESATAAIKDAGVLADVVALEQSGKALEALQSLATAGQGQVISSDPAALQAAFAAEADVLARQVLVTATLPVGLRQDRGDHQGHPADLRRLGHRRGVLAGRAGRPGDRPRTRPGRRRRGRCTPARSRSRWGWS